MVCISFDQVIQHLITKFSKEKPIFWYFAFFSIGKAASHMIFPFLELLKICLQHLKRSPDCAPDQIT
jgi:hypothetical protein